MNKIANLSDLLRSMTIGFEDLSLPQYNKPTSFPPHNIIKTCEYNYEMQFALAGFSKDDIDVTIEDGTLIISGSQEKDDEDAEYLYRGISARSFTKSFKLDQDIEVKGGSMENGVLVVELEKIIPESKKPRTIRLR